MSPLSLLYQKISLFFEFLFGESVYGESMNVSIHPTRMSGLAIVAFACSDVFIFPRTIQWKFYARSQIIISMHLIGITQVLSESDSKSLKFLVYLNLPHGSRFLFRGDDAAKTIYLVCGGKYYKRPAKVLKFRHLFHFIS